MVMLMSRLAGFCLFASLMGNSQARLEWPTLRGVNKRKLGPGAAVVG